mmetsp:Transcript_21409/g.54571  ORF Transcript_21409/g.54571 Transcript_21409/m.54571 type:complete len:661 (+) Transcript_21409:92-2074(+)
MSDDEMSDDFPAYSAAPPLPEGIKKEVIKEGEGYRRPKAGDELKVHYVGTLESDGSEFDSSRARDEPITLNLGKGEVIKGWDLGLATMRKGEIAKFTLQPQFAYGEAGMAPAIPPSAVLIFEVEVISWMAKDDLFNDGGVTKAVEKDGEGFNNPKDGQEVRMSIKATSGGKVLEDRQLFDYVLGSGTLGSMTKVVDKSLTEMNAGGKVNLYCEKGYVFPDEDKVKIELTLDEVYEVNDVSILKDGTVMKKTLQDSEDYEKPKDGYKATLKVVAATDGTNPLPGFTGPTELSFVCGNGDVCDAIEGAAVEMKLHERAIITAPADKCQEPKLGLQGLKEGKVQLTLELLDREKGQDLWSMHYEDKLDNALDRKEIGGKLFKAKRFELALDKYKKAQELVRETSNWSDDAKGRAKELTQVCELNKAAVWLQLNEPTNALSCCNEVLKEDPHNVKAIFRRSKAQFSRGEHAAALRDLDRVIEMDPSNTEAKALVPKVKQAQKLADKESRSTFAKMCEGFGKLGSGKENKKPIKAEEPKEEEPQQDPNTVVLTFRIDLKLPAQETLHVMGAPESLGASDPEKAVALRRLPPKYEPPVGSGRAPPETNFWEGTAEIPQDEGRVEYKYVVKGPSGTRVEDGDPHVVQLSGMGGCRQKTTDSWRSKGG